MFTIAHQQPVVDYHDRYDRPTRLSIRIRMRALHAVIADFYRKPLEPEAIARWQLLDTLYESKE